MNIVYLLWLSWFIVGLVLWYFLDAQWMRQEVPYGQFPSGMALLGIRVICFVTIMTFWPPILVRSIIKAIRRPE